MADKYKIRHNDTIINLQLNDQVEEMNNEFKEDVNKSYFSIVNSIFKYIKNYLLTMGKPSFKKRKANYKFDSKEYNQNNIEIVNDIKNAFSEINQLKNIIKDNFNYSNIFNDFIRKQVDKLEDKTEGLNVYIDNPHKNIITINENFRDKTTLDLQNSDASVRNEIGQVTLGISDYKKQMMTAEEGTKIEILDSSNGYEGNFNQVITKGNDENIFIERAVNPAPKDKRSWQGSNIQYIWEKFNNLHMDKDKMIDNNPDSWFEYELCNVPNRAKAKTCHNEFEDYKCTSKGWNWHYVYNDGSKETWARDPEDGILKLDLRITLPEPRYANYIDIDSFITPYDDYNRSFQNFEVKEVRIARHESADRELIYHRDISFEKSYLDKIPDYENFNQDTDFSNRIFNFRPQNVQVIEIFLEQPNSYDCWIGHEYGWFDAKYKIETKTVIITWSKDYVEAHNRIPIDPRNRDDIMDGINSGVDIGDMIKGGLLGAAVGAGVISMTSLAWNPYLFIAAVIGALLTSKDVKTIYEKATGPWLEAFKGWRYAIGIRDINLNSYIYNPEATIITKEYDIPKPIKKIEVEFTQEIPSIFYSNETDQTSYKNHNNWLQHFVSVDNGVNWYPITDNKFGSDIPSVYYVNTAPVDIEHSGKVGYIESDEISKKIKFKSILNRPTDLKDAEFFTPILDNITAKIEVISEEEDLDEY